MQIRSISDWQCEIGENCLKTKSLDQPRRLGCHVYIEFNAPLSKITPAMPPKNV